MSRRWRKLAADLVLAGILMALFATGALSFFDHRLQDALFQRPDLPNPDIAIIGIDEKAIELFGNPNQWSRELMASAIELLNSSIDCRPAVVAVDVLYVGEGRDAGADERLAAAARDGGNVVTAARAIPGYERSGTDPHRAVQTIIGFERPFAALADHSNYGFINAINDEDLRVRSARFVYEFDGETMFSFPFVVYQNYLGFESPETMVFETDSYITYSGEPGTFKLFSFADIFNEDFEPEYLEGLIVLIGAYAPGLMDDFFVPGHSDRMHGVEIHANIVQMLLDDNLKQYSPAIANWAVMVIVVIIALVLANVLEIRLLLAVFFGISAAYFGVALLVFNNGYILTLVYPVSSLVLIYIYQLIYGYVSERIERKKAQLVAEKHRILIDSINYASVIQRGILPKDSAFERAFKDYCIIWEPRDTVSGDIYWLKNFEKGAFLAVCDCTGHGVPGALLTALVTSALEEIVTEENCDAPGTVMWMLDQKLARIFGGGSGKQVDGCDPALLFISRDGDVSIASGNIPVFICDGKEVARIKGQRIFVGEGKIGAAGDVRVTSIPAGVDKKFYVSTDGLFEQPGGAHGYSFGYNTFKQVILDNHLLDLRSVSDRVRVAFDGYRGSQSRRDDFTFVAFCGWTRNARPYER